MRRAIHLHRPRGFTLLELIVVAAIIAVFAAVALPRLIDTQRDARSAKARTIHGALRSAATLARSRCELDLAAAAASLPSANCQALPPQVNMDGHAVDIVNRFPSASASGIDVAAGLNPAADGLATDGPGCPAGARCFDIAGGTAPHCRITYAPATLSGGVVTAPAISIDTGGC